MLSLLDVIFNWYLRPVQERRPLWAVIATFGYLTHGQDGRMDQTERSNVMKFLT